jgi:deoxyribodipyrimidine photolyase-related protein
LRSLIVVLGDQLDPDAAAFEGFDPALDAVWMAEVAEEAEHVWSAKQRIAMFLAAMRHFAQELRSLGRTLHYTQITADGGAVGGPRTLADELRGALAALRPERLIMTAPGEWRVLQDIKAVAVEAEVALDIREDRHFFSTVRQFAAFAKAHKTLRLETFYQLLRRQHGVLMENDEPVGARFNFDAENRGHFGRKGPPPIPERFRIEPDAITRDVIALVNQRFAQHPGSLVEFCWPVTRAQAVQALRCFVTERLPTFGTYQDAMWTGEAWLYHSHLSAVLNLKLLAPRDVIAAAEEAYRSGEVPLASAEGFIRQILGWREYVRGIYWTRMPGYLDLNGLAARENLPAWYWTGDTDMTCLHEAIGQTLRQGYAHHIQRLMVTGLYALLLGVQPRQVHEWYLAVYVDAVEWVELPNVLGMSQYADSGYMGSKPYIASGRYIDRMSNYCAGCRYDPAERVGPNACPFTTLYWDFLARHRPLLSGNRRMTFQLKNLERLSPAERDAIAVRAAELRRGDSPSS